MRRGQDEGRALTLLKKLFRAELLDLVDVLDVSHLLAVTPVSNEAKELVAVARDKDVVLVAVVSTSVIVNHASLLAAQVNVGKQLFRRGEERKKEEEKKKKEKKGQKDEEEIRIK